MGGRAEQLPVPTHRERVAVRHERHAALIQLLRPDELIERQVRQRARGVELGVVGLGGLTELQIESKIALRLAFDRGGIDLDAGLFAQRLAVKQVGEQVGGSGQVRLRLSIDDRAWRRVRDLEDEVVGQNPPRRRQVHDGAVGRDPEDVAVERSGSGG